MKFIKTNHSHNIYISKEDVTQIVLEIVKDREHPFKKDGPHRHWFKSFFTRNPYVKHILCDKQGRKQKLSSEIISNFVSEIKK